MPLPPKVVVLGSLNVDYFVRVDQFPVPGETVMGSELEVRFGGKGANQAVVACGLGAKVAMLGRVGDDDMGERYRQRMAAFGIDAAGIEVATGVATGSAFINVDSCGENTIVVAPGANGEVRAENVRAGATQIGEADVLLLQNEVPHEANVEAAKIASGAGTLVVYNPAPWDSERDLSELTIDLLIVNESEAAGIDDLDAFPRRAITRGSQSTLGCSAGQRFEVSVEDVEAIDTVGAGDAFVAAMAVKLAEDAPFGEAIAFANREAAKATLHRGAQREVAS